MLGLIVNSSHFEYFVVKIYLKLFVIMIEISYV